MLPKSISYNYLNYRSIKIIESTFDYYFRRNPDYLYDIHCTDTAGRVGTVWQVSVIVGYGD